jgi:uncharacterized protein YbgA (DUF1722 family)/uncharacterized protein YbbK (DUF523 family)
MSDKYSEKPVIGVSSCLLGNNVRFDGGHKRDRLITDVLAEHMSIKTVCPEVGIGLGIPRPAIRLQDINGETRLVASKDKSQDFTEAMTRYSSEVIDSLSTLDGFIFKKGSPSCGAFRVPVVVHEEGHRRHDGTGLFAGIFMERYPWIPVEEEGRLNDEILRQNFLERVYALHRWNRIPDADENISEFIRFHARHKLMLMARDQVQYQRLGRWVAETTADTLKERRQIYLQEFMKVMKKKVTKGRHVNVMMHVMGYLKNQISGEDKKELLHHFESFRNDYLPLTALLLLIKHHFRKYPDPYISDQYYLEPYPQRIKV